MKRFHHFRVLFIALLWLASVEAWAATVTVVVTEENPAWAGVIEKLKSDLEQESGAKTRVELRVFNPSQDMGVRPSDVWVPFDLKALRWVLKNTGNQPVVSLMVQRAHYESQAQTAPGRKLSGVFIDQPVSRQLNLIRAALPRAREVGMMVSADSPISEPMAEMQARARERGLVFKIGRVEDAEDIYPALQQALDGADVLLTIPDPQLYNGRTIQNILLTSYRAGVPLLGFSSAYVRAGAALALYSTPDQMVKQAVPIILTAIQGGLLPPARHPQDYTVQVNTQVARSLGMRVLDDEVLHAALKAREGNP